MNKNQVCSTKLDEDGEDSPEEGTPEPAAPLARTLFPSSFGMSFSLDLSADSFTIGAHWAQYLRDKDAEGKSVWVRQPRSGDSQPVSLKEGTLPVWTPDSNCRKVVVRGRARKREGHWSVTLFLCNEQDEDRPKDQSWLFQPELRARGDFVRQCERSYLTTLSTSDRAEDQVNEMLYPA